VSEASIRVAAILLLAVPTVEIGGVSLLAMITRRLPGYLDNPVRRHLFRAGHAHAGVWIILALVGLLYVDQTDLSGGWKAAVRLGFAIAPILMPLGFFLSILRTDSEKPNGVLWLTILAGLALAFATITLGIGLLTT
jgi:heme/copper-type cytochrome/quinol oxidase subunit 4